MIDHDQDVVTSGRVEDLKKLIVHVVVRPIVSEALPTRVSAGTIAGPLVIRWIGKVECGNNSCGTGGGFLHYDLRGTSFIRDEAAIRESRRAVSIVRFGCDTAGRASRN